jgi:aminoglycoside 3-N-acetyltransferase
MSTDAAASIASLTEDLRRLGIREGDVLVVHTSFRAVRPVEGGPAGLIEALRRAVGTSGTLVMPSWGDDDDAPFDVVLTKVADDLGVTAEVFRRLPDAKRSDHPFAFAALGPHAAEIVGDPLPSRPHELQSPIGRSWELDAKVLLLGVDHDADTTIHLAECMAEVPYAVAKHCTVAENGNPRRVDYFENDHCCQRFNLAGEWLRARGLEREGRVGSALARLASARAIVTVALDALERDPLVFLHPVGHDCEECRSARASVRG